MPTQQQAFNPAVIMKKYSQQQWEIKEDYYTKKCQEISIPINPLPSDIQSCAIKIDNLLSTARIDHAYVKQQFDMYEMQLKIQEKTMFIDLKQSPSPQFANMKFTVDEVKGAVAKCINDNKYNNTSYSLYELVRISGQRLVFMEAVIKVLQDKKDLLITHSGMLKIENSLNSLAPNTVTNNQFDENAAINNY